MRLAIIAGDLEALQHAAARLASDEWTPQLVRDHLVNVSAVRSAARTVRASESLSDAARALGEVGATCAACHRDSGAPLPAARGGSTEEKRGGMSAHAAAEQALWDGLVLPSDASWSSGARGLSDAPELDSDVEAVSFLAGRIRGLAREAATAGPTRGEVYGRILATCSACHTQAGVGRR